MEHPGDTQDGPSLVTPEHWALEDQVGSQAHLPHTDFSGSQKVLEGPMSSGTRFLMERHKGKATPHGRALPLLGKQRLFSKQMWNPTPFYKPRGNLTNHSTESILYRLNRVPQKRSSSPNLCECGLIWK